LWPRDEIGRGEPPAHQAPSLVARIGQQDMPDLVGDDPPERAAQIDRPDLRVTKQHHALGYQQRFEQLFRLVVIDADWHVVDPLGHQVRAAEHDPRPGPA
jgi:hypothetical protein